MWSSESYTKDAIVQIDEKLWVRVSTIEYLRPYILKSGHTEIGLASGSSVSTPKTQAEIIEILRKAMPQKTVFQ